MDYCLRLIIKNAKIIGVLLLLALCIIGTQIQHFKLDASAESLILETDNSFSYYQNLRKKYGNDDYLVIVYQVVGDLLHKKHLTNIAEIKAKLLSIKEIATVTSILDVPLFQSPAITISQLANNHISIDNNNANYM